MFQTIPSRIEYQHSDLCRQSLTPEQELALYVHYTAAIQQNLSFYREKEKKKKKKTRCQHFISQQEKVHYR